MRVLVACEFSGIVRDAFLARGHDAVSCDILPTESEGPHIQGDIIEALEVLDDDFDLMIAHPPCTHLAVSGARHFEEKRKDGRQQEGIDFFMKMINAPIKKIAVENPVGIMSNVYREPDDIINPWQFGDEFSKKTCLWLKNLDPLIPTEIVEKGDIVTAKSGKRMAKWYSESFSLSPDERAKIRSKTFPGIAKAMAAQFTQPQRQISMF